MAENQGGIITCLGSVQKQAGKHVSVGFRPSVRKIDRAFNLALINQCREVKNFGAQRIYKGAYTATNATHNSTQLKARISFNPIFSNTFKKTGGGYGMDG